MMDYIPKTVLVNNLFVGDRIYSCGGPGTC